MQSQKQRRNTEDTAFRLLKEFKHGVRVIADEEGVKAAAYAVEQAAGAAKPPEEVIDFVLDRPFMFVLTGQDGSVLFSGVVRNIE